MNECTWQQFREVMESRRWSLFGGKKGVVCSGKIYLVLGPFSTMMFCLVDAKTT
jgi:hypothetical protein